MMIEIPFWLWIVTCVFAGAGIFSLAKTVVELIRLG